MAIQNVHDIMHDIQPRHGAIEIERSLNRWLRQCISRRLHVSLASAMRTVAARSVPKLLSSRNFPFHPRGADATRRQRREPCVCSATKLAAPHDMTNSGLTKTGHVRVEIAGYDV
jgi:hypothetical protein